MSGELEPVTISRELLERVFAEAKRAYPDECCGWLAGPRGGGRAEALRACENVQAAGDHPTATDRSAETAYVIAGRDLLELTRALDGDYPPLVIYHSHPNGMAYFSATDREVATSPWGDGPAYPVQQLVVGVTADRVTEAALFAYSETDADFVEIARYAGEGQGAGEAP